jgi:putative N6-adenine-specific DNA methylase
LDSFRIKSIKDINSSVKNNITEIKKFITDDKTFSVRCFKQDNEDFSTEEICLEAADSFATKSKVNLNNPDVILFIYICSNTGYLGIDLSGEDLSKRDYRIYVHQEALKANIAYSLLRIADYDLKDIILDPFCGSGTILIEAALFATNTSPNFYSKDKFAFLKLFSTDLTKLDKKQTFEGKLIGYDKELRHVVAAKKNAKIAGVEDSIEFSRSEIEWIDTKQKITERSIDKIITNPPNLTKRINEKDIEKLYKQLFYQADFILKKEGTVTLITKTESLMKKAAEKYKFKVVHEREITIGTDKNWIIVFGK